MSPCDDKNQNTDPIKVGSQAFDEKIQRLDRLANIGLVSASVAHEIKNGLVAINTFVELLLEKGQDTELAETVHRELRRIDGLVTQMMRFANPNRGGKTGASRTTVQIHELFEHTLRLLHYPLNAKQIKIERNFTATKGGVHGDETQLQQVLMNLTLNAVEAMDNGGTLTLNTFLVDHTDKPHILIEVKDTGVGISGENFDHLFEPFFTTKKNGTGLGLSICKRIIDEHHGAISARSEPNKGSTISILLPASH